MPSHKASHCSNSVSHLSVQRPSSLSNRSSGSESSLPKACTVEFFRPRSLNFTLGPEALGLAGCGGAAGKSEVAGARGSEEAIKSFPSLAAAFMLEIHGLRQGVGEEMPARLSQRTWAASGAGCDELRKEAPGLINASTFDAHEPCPLEAFFPKSNSESKKSLKSNVDGCEADGLEPPVVSDVTKAATSARVRPLTGEDVAMDTAKALGAST